MDIVKVRSLNSCRTAGWFYLMESKPIIDELRNHLKESVSELNRKYDKIITDVVSTNIDEELSKIDEEKENKIAQLKAELNETLESLDDNEQELLREKLLELFELILKSTASTMISQEYREELEKAADEDKKYTYQALETGLEERKQEYEKRKNYSTDEMLEICTEKSEKLIEERDIENKIKIKKVEEETCRIFDTLNREYFDNIISKLAYIKQKKELLSMELEDILVKNKIFVEKNEQEHIENTEKEINEILEKGRPIKEETTQKIDVIDTTIRDQVAHSFFYENWFLSLNHFSCDFHYLKLLYRDVFELKKLIRYIKKRQLENQAIFIKEEEFISLKHKNTTAHKKYLKETEDIFIQNKLAYEDQLIKIKNELIYFTSKCQMEAKVFKEMMADKEKKTLKNHPNEVEGAINKALIKKRSDIKKTEDEISNLEKVKEKLTREQKEKFKRIDDVKVEYKTYLNTYLKERDKRRVLDDQLREISKKVRSIARLQAPAKPPPKKFYYPDVAVVNEGQVELYHKKNDLLSYFEVDKAFGSNSKYVEISSELINQYKYFLEGYDMVLLSYGDRTYDDCFMGKIIINIR